MSDREPAADRLLDLLHDLEARYDAARDELSADAVFVIWTALWRFSEKVIADHRRLKAAERKRRRIR